MNIRKLITYTVTLTLFILFFIACREDLMTSVNLFEGSKKDTSALLDLITVKKHFRELTKQEATNNGSKTSSARSVNKKYAIFEKAYISATNQSSFVEVPLLFNQRKAIVYNKEFKGDSKINNEIFNGSFDRLVVFKDKKSGRIDERIITYIPTVGYLRSCNHDISHNKIDKLDENFMGYLEYKTWDGTRLYLLEVKFGKVTKRIYFPRKGSKGQKNLTKTSEIYVCGFENIPIFQTTCVTADPEGSLSGGAGGSQYCTTVYIGEESIPILCDSGMDGDPCELYNIGCDPGPGGAPEDYCELYGLCGEGESPSVPEPPRIIENQLVNDCMHAVLEKLLADVLENQVSSILHYHFGQNADVEVSYSDSESLPGNLNGRLNLDKSQKGYNPATQKWTTYLSIDINSAKLAGASQELAGAVMLHEAVHGYFRLMGIETQFDHDLMASGYRGAISDILVSVFNMSPQSANAVAWTGLATETNSVWSLYKSTHSQSDINSIVNTLNSHQNGTSGTKCP